MIINPATTADSGKYSCCGQAGDDSVCTSADADISFGISSSSDSIDIEPPITSEISCFDYPTNNAGICQKYLSGKSVHAETLEGIYAIEKQIKTAFNQLRGKNKLTARCDQFAPGAFCHYLLPTCGRDSTQQVRLCRADCEMLKNSVCDAEFRNFTENAGRSGIDLMISQIANRFECEKLPQSIEGDHCSTIGLPPVLNTSHACYESTGLGESIFNCRQKFRLVF